MDQYQTLKERQKEIRSALISRSVTTEMRLAACINLGSIWQQKMDAIRLGSQRDIHDIFPKDWHDSSCVNDGYWEVREEVRDYSRRIGVRYQDVVKYIRAMADFSYQELSILSGDEWLHVADPRFLVVAVMNS